MYLVGGQDGGAVEPVAQREAFAQLPLAGTEPEELAAHPLGNLACEARTRGRWALVATCGHINKTHNALRRETRLVGIYMAIVQWQQEKVFMQQYQCGVPRFHSLRAAAFDQLPSVTRVRRLG